MLRKLKKKKSMSNIQVQSTIEEYEYRSLISSSSSSKIRIYDIPGLIVTSITAPGLLTLYDPLNFMEDFVDISSFMVKNKSYELFAIYDGHGGKDKYGIKRGGDEVAKECVKYLPEVIKDTLRSHNNVKESLIKSFEKADKEHFLSLNKFPENVGSTAIVVLKHNRTLYMANLGDSRAVICCDGKVRYETIDHDWTNPKERERIGLNKDKQTCIVKTPSGNKKFILNGKFLNGEKWNLATSRSFGDYHFKLGSEKPPVTAKPQVDKLMIDDRMKLILIASDGIWENEKGLTSEHFISKFIQIAKKQTSINNVDECLKETCKEFVKWCLIDHLKFDYKNYGDNISIIAIGLLNGQTKQQWFQEIQKWEGKYEDDSLILRDINDTIEEDSHEDIDYGSDSESCKIDFTQL